MLAWTPLGLASLECSIARQRVRFSWLCGNDVTFSFLKVHASHWTQFNLMTCLRVGDQVVTEHDTIAEAAFHHNSNVLGSANVRGF